MAEELSNMDSKRASDDETEGKLQRDRSGQISDVATRYDVYAVL